MSIIKFFLYAVFLIVSLLAVDAFKIPMKVYAHFAVHHAMKKGVNKAFKLGILAAMMEQSGGAVKLGGGGGSGGGSGGGQSGGGGGGGINLPLSFILAGR